MENINLITPGTGHSAPITGVSVSTDGRHVATSSYDGTIKVWNLNGDGTLTELATGRHTRLVNSLTWAPTASRLASGSADKTVAIWTLLDNRLQLTNVLSRHTDDVNSVAWLPDGRHLVCVSEDGKATAWDADTGRLLGEISGHRAHCMMVATSPTGHIATVGEDGQVILLGPDFAPLATTVVDCSIEGCAWAPDGKRLAIARDDGRIDVLDLDLQMIATTKVSGSAARSISWSATGEHLAVGSYEGGIRVLDSPSLESHLQLNHRALWTRSIAYAADRIIAGGFGSRPLVFDAEVGGVLGDGGRQLRGPNALLPRAGHLLLGTDSGEVLRYDETGTGVSIADLDSPILSLAADGDTVFAGTYGGEVVRLTGPADDLRADGVGLAGAPVPSLSILDGRVVAGTYNGELIGFDTDDMTPSVRHQAHDGSIKSLARLGKYLAAASTDRTVSVGTLTKRHPVLQHGNLINDVAHSDGFIASASRDRTVRVARLTDSTDGSPPTDVRVLTGPDESVKCVGLVAWGDRLAVFAGSYDFRVYVWDVNFAEPATGRYPHRVVHVFDQAVSALSAAPDGAVYAAGWDGRVVRFIPRIAGDRLEVDTTTVVETCLSPTDSTVVNHG
ncbi:WD40 repeat protein [Stackebrandtia endophytica]|uniref:WD40 repeat protein n=1 Tax=Stackebrandtia endophytica TaxID=1496996 RepID=A0A543AQN1_9ACTN|nr:WD40 repeat domain-containing protein [Stackebrandtia endophytica]TQL74897.1 WD40 repeat protein [Stackebrandtia endophytica]